MVVGSTTIEARITDFPFDVTDQMLMQRLLRRDLSALEELINRHRSVAIGLACRIVHDRNHAEDVVQDAFLTLWRQPERYDPARGSVRSWLLAIVHHRSIDKLRRLATNGRLVELTPDIVDHSAVDPSEQAVQAVERDNVRAALDRLPADQRRAIELSFLHGRTHAEIAELMNCPLGTVKGRIRIGLEKLRTMIQPTDLVAA
ncbi:MAG TPA: sigma-70 family RNA polymerase sigma factor [Thermomicrobiales bacterium]|nr:sigma-70 family RNA polymerase sigma factor [Thermomicrobiales bacterium]